MNKIESMYLHFPFCKHLCNYCDFYKKVSQNRSQDLQSFHFYLQNSFNEHEKLMKANGYSWAPLKTLYIGGGTPSLWGVEGAQFLKKFMAENSIQLNEGCEFTLEVNPGAWDENILNEWESVGVNRYSLGIQSLDGILSKYLDRVHSIDDVYETLNFFHKRKHNFSVDFMLGLPYSESLNRKVIDELNIALKYGPTHFSVYVLTVKNNYIHYSNLPSEEWIEKEYLEVAHHLKAHNYKHYEVSNFSLENKESVHNLRYWNSQTVAAFGPSATGFLQEKKIRYKWKTNEAKFEVEILTDEQYKLEKVYMALRSDTGLDRDQFTANKSEILEKWLKNNWAIISENNMVKLTSEGFLVLDSLMDDLFICENLKK